MDFSPSTGLAPRALAAVILIGLVVGCAADAGGPSVAGPTVPTAPLRAESVDGPLADHFDLEGASLWVGSEDVPTQRLLGHVAVEALESVGADVEPSLGIGGSLDTRERLQSGEIDMYWERVAAAWTGLLREAEVEAELEELRGLLATRDLEENGVVWLAPAGFNDGPGFAMAEDYAEVLDISSLEEMAAYIDDGMPASVCVTSEFMTFADQGRMDFEAILDVEIPDDALRELDAEPIYAHLGDGTCLFGLVDRADGRLLQYDLRLLEDDAFNEDVQDDGDGRLFPLDNPAMAVREDVYAEHPELGRLFALLAGALDEQAIQEMSQRVEIDQEDPRAVARDWLVQEGFISE